jgi:hypothetical protein
VVGVYLKNLLEIRERIIVTVGIEHLSLLDLIHETAVTVGISYNHAWLSCETIGNYNIINLFEKDLLGVLYEWLVFLR